jgi:hypothetical protein
LVHEAVRACGSIDDVNLAAWTRFFPVRHAWANVGSADGDGFTDAASYSFHQEWRVANADHYIESILNGTVRARAVLAAQSGTAAVGVRSYIADYLARFRSPTGDLVVPMPAIINSGARPG